MFWKYDTHSPIKSTASLSADGSTIFFGNEEVNILALSAYGKLKWYLKTGGAVSAPTLITNSGLLFTGSRDGSVYILKDISTNLNKRASAVKLEWPTYLGNNQRTGDQKYLFTDVEKKEMLVDQFSLMQNYPNPFNPAAE
jgi:hypothetical protein